MTGTGDDPTDAPGTAGVARSAERSDSTDDAPGATATSPIATRRPSERDAGSGGLGRSRRRRLLAPAGLALTYVLLAAVAGPGVFDTSASGAAGAVAGLLLGALALVAVWATLGLFEDAADRSAGSDDWRLDPWLHVGGGAVVLTGIRVLEVATGALSPTYPVPYVLGTAVVAVLLAPVLAGPSYVLLADRVRPSDSCD